jgi:hypothetical protein
LIETRTGAVQTKQRSLLARLGAAESAPPWSLTAAAFSIAAAVIAMFAGTFVGLAWFDPAPHAGVAGWAVGGIMGALLVYQTRRAQLDALKLGASRTPLLFVMFIALGLALLFDVIGLAVTGVFSPSPELLILSASGTISAAGWFFRSAADGGCAARRRRAGLPRHRAAVAAPCAGRMGRG